MTTIHPPVGPPTSPTNSKAAHQYEAIQNIGPKIVNSQYKPDYCYIKNYTAAYHLSHTTRGHHYRPNTKQKCSLLGSSSILNPTLVFISLIILLVLPTPSTSETTMSNSLSGQYYKNSGHCKYNHSPGQASRLHSSSPSNSLSLLTEIDHIAQICAGKSQFPFTKRVEGAVLTSQSDTDINCTITLRTKSSHQHFVIRFEQLKLGCNDHLKMFDGDLDYGQPSIKDFSCRDNLANVQPIKTTGTYLTLRFSSDYKAKQDDGFRLVVTAVMDPTVSECPPDYAYCRNRLCISRSLFCDDVNHCVDNSDEESCSSRNGGIGGTSNGFLFAGDLSLSNALGLLIVLVLVIFTCVIIFISAIYCRRENQYAQYQHHLQRAVGVPMQTSSSLMFTNQHPQYQYFQPANLSPYITPQHHAIATTLPRGYSTLPLNITRQQPNQLVAKSNNIGNNEYLMMAGLAGPPTSAMQATPTIQTNLYMPTSQSILPNVRYQVPKTG